MIMAMSFKQVEKEIETYCLTNGLSFQKAKSMVKSCGLNNIWLMYHDPDKGKNGLMDETPMPIALIIDRINGQLVFKQTEHTKKYLA